MTADRFPLGEPLNRPADASKRLTPIEGRPNWFRTADGAEKYVEPPAKTDPAKPASALALCELSTWFRRGVVR